MRSHNTCRQSKKVHNRYIIFSRKTTAIAVGGLALLALSSYSLTGGGVNVASVITGTNTQTNKCIALLSDSKRISAYEVTKTRLNTDLKKDVILKATTEKQCGSAGCSHELCITTDEGVEIIPFGYAAETLIVKDTLSNGMRDIQLTGKSTTNLQWDGTRYTVSQ